jgi:hypothetical protein
MSQTFCTDTDLLNWEPNLFRDAAAATQLVIAGTGDLAGTTLTIASGSFTDEDVAEDGVIALEGDVAGCYSIVSIDSATQLTIGIVNEGLYPESGPKVASPVGTGSAIGYAIRTFWPQRKVVSDLLKRAAGIGLEAGIQRQDWALLGDAPMRRPCALGTLQMIYSALAAAAAEPASYATRAEMYQRLYRRALEQTRVEIDTNGDGRADLAKVLGVVDLARV